MLAPACNVPGGMGIDALPSPSGDEIGLEGSVVLLMRTVRCELSGATTIEFW